MLSNYALYIKERENKDIIETEKGFATYYFDEDCVYIADVYIRPEFRQSGIAKSFFDTIEDIAREKNMKESVTFVDKTAIGSDLSQACLLKNNFEICGFINNMIFFKREL